MKVWIPEMLDFILSLKWKITCWQRNTSVEIFAARYSKKKKKSNNTLRQEVKTFEDVQALGYADSDHC